MKLIWPEKVGALCATMIKMGQQEVITGKAVVLSSSGSDNILKGGASTLMSRDYKSASDLIVDGKPPRKYIVRRLTPTECARLQGFPDEWCEGLGGSDSAIYKAYGNGLALPCAYDVMNRIARFVEHEKED